MLEKNLQEIEFKIQEACRRAKRNRDEVTLIAVSKTKPISMLKEVYNLGIRNFGENKVQELCEKHPQMCEDTIWHLIGHLQTNKVKQVIDKATLIHSIDSVRLAEVVEKEAAKRDLTVDVLIEVNVAKEESKYGFTEDQVLSAVETIATFPHIHICGFMTIAPFVEKPEDNRSVFARLKKLSVDIAAKNIDNVSVDILSMGMTNDYEVAIEEGATMVRVGTGIFGAREYHMN